MSVPPRVRQPLQEQHSYALAPARPVRRVGERLAAAVRGQRSLPAELHERRRCRHDRHSPGQGQRALPRPQCLDRQVQRYERGGACGVDGHRRPFQAEGVREPARDDTRGVAGGQRGRSGVGGAEQNRGVVLAVGPREHAGAGAPHRGRADTGPLEGLPRGFEQQPLLGVHPQRLTRRDPEEAGVEVARVVDEAAFVPVSGPGAAPVLAVQPAEIPAPVRRELRDGVAAFGDQVPQVLRGPDAAGVAAAHADDRNRVVVGAENGGIRSDGLGVLAAEHRRQQARGDVVRRRVVEDEGCGQIQPGRLVESVTQLDSGQGIETKIAEGSVGGDGLGRRVAEYGCGLGPHEVEQFTDALGRGESGQPGAEHLGGPCPEVAILGRVVPQSFGHFRDVTDQRPGARQRERGREQGPVDVRDGQARLSRLDGAYERSDGQPRVHAREPAAGEHVLGGAVGHAATGPAAPGDRCGGEPSAAPVLRQAVQVGVARRVGALSGGAPYSGARGEQDERVEGPAGFLPEEAVEVRGAGHLGGDGFRDVRGIGFGEPGHDGRSCGVDDRPDWPAVGFPDLVHERGECVTVADVTGCDRHPGAQRDEFVVQRESALGGGSSATGEHEVLDASAGQVPGDVRSQRTSPAGDESGATRVPRRGGGGCLGTDEPASEDSALPQGDLVLSDGPGQHGAHARPRPGVEGVRVRREVDEATPALGALQAEHPAQAPGQ